MELVSEKASFLVKIDGVEYKVRQPLVKDLKKLGKINDKAGANVLEDTINFISELGVPSEILEEMNMETLEKLVTFVTTPKKK